MEESSTKPSSLKGKFADVFGSLDALEAKHEKFVKENLSENESTLKREPDNEDGLDRKRSRPDNWRSNDYGDRRRGGHGGSYHEGQCIGGRKDGECDRDRSGEGFQPPPPRYRQNRGRGKVPDHKVHPDRWTRYDLSDVDQSQLSERSNSSAAFAFLNQLHNEKNLGSQEESDIASNDSMLDGNEVVFKKPRFINRNRKLPSDQQSSRDTRSNEGNSKTDESELQSGNNEMEMPKLDSKCDKIEFRKPSKKPIAPSSDNDECTSTTTYRDGKLVMPEYVVGSCKNSKKLKRKECKDGDKQYKIKGPGALSFNEDAEENEADEDNKSDIGNSENKGHPAAKSKHLGKKRNNFRTRDIDDGD